MESLYKFKKENGHVPIPDILLLDEFCSLIEHYVSSTMTRGKRIYFTEVVTSLLRSAQSTSIILDAYLTDADIETIMLMADGTSKNVWINKNGYRESTKRLEVYSDSVAFHRELMNSLLSCIRSYTEDWDREEPSTSPLKRCYIASNSKEQLLGVYAMFTQAVNASTRIDAEAKAEIMARTIVLCSDSDEELKETFSFDPNRSWVNADRLFCSPTVTAGVSFDVEHFHHVYGLAVNTTSSPRSFMQQLNRVRTAIDGTFRVYVPENDDNMESVSYDTVFNDMTLIQAWLGAKYSELIDIQFTEQGGSLIPALKRDSVHNHLIVRNIVDRINFKYGFTDRLMDILEYDWFDVELDENGKNLAMNFLYRKSARQLRRTIATLESRAPNDPKPWVHDYDKNLVRESSSVLEVTEFYNVFPIGGPLRLRQNCRPKTKRMGAFVSKWHNTTAQQNFERIIFRKLGSFKVTLMDEGRCEQMEPIAFTYVRNILLRLFHMSGILMDSDLAIITGDRRVIPYDSRSLGTSESVVIHTRFEMDIRANCTREFRIKETVMFEHWEDLVDVIANNITVLRSISTSKSLNKVVGDSKTQKDITNATRIIAALVKFIGLTCSVGDGLSKKPVATSQLRIGRTRYRLREYRVYNFDDRFMFSLLRSEHMKVPSGSLIGKTLVDDIFGLLKSGQEGQIDPETTNSMARRYIQFALDREYPENLEEAIYRFYATDI